MVEGETVFANSLTKGEHVDSEEEGSKHRVMMHTLVDWSFCGTGVSNGDKLGSICL